MRSFDASRKCFIPVVLGCLLLLLAGPAAAQDTNTPGSYVTGVAAAFSAKLTVTGVSQPLVLVAAEANVYGPKAFTPQGLGSTFAATDANGTLQAAYKYSSPTTFSWRYNVNPDLCAGGVLQGGVVANIYNNGGLVPATHYSKAGVSPCYGFHASFPGNTKINSKGNYQLSGALTWKKGNATYNLGFVFNFVITYV